MVIPFKKKGTPINQWAVTANYVSKQYGKAKANRWINANVPEQFKKLIKGVL